MLRAGAVSFRLPPFLQKRIIHNLALTIIPHPWVENLTCHLYNHLRYTLAAQCLAANKGLALDASKEIADARESEDDSGGNQASRSTDKRQPLHESHDAVGARAHVVGGDLANSGIERGRGWADAQEQGDLDEEDNEGGHTTGALVLQLWGA